MSSFICSRCGGGHQRGVDPPGDVHAQQCDLAQSLNTDAVGKYFALQVTSFVLADGFSGSKIVPWSYIVFLTSECTAFHVSLSYKLSTV